MTLAPGTQLGHYAIVSQLGQGGMGVVTLKQRIERGPVELDDAIDIAIQVGQGLAWVRCIEPGIPNWTGT